MTPRLDCPKKGNPFYTSKQEGGLNPGTPRPKDSKQIFQNCVFYALGRFAELWGVWLRSTNAENFIKVAREMGLTVSNTPAEGAIICWEGVGAAAGHVAVVEIVNANDIVTSESGWNNYTKPFWTQTRKKGGNWGMGSAYKFLGFILPPAQPAPTRKTVREGDKGADVKAMQERLAAHGFLRKTEIDGDYGLITLGALCGFQYKKGLEIDAVCGPKTWEALLK